MSRELYASLIMIMCFVPHEPIDRTDLAHMRQRMLCHIVSGGSVLSGLHELMHSPAMQPGRSPSPIDREMSYSAQISRISSQCVYAKFSVWSSRHSCTCTDPLKPTPMTGCRQLLGSLLGHYAFHPTSCFAEVSFEPENAAMQTLP